MDVGKFALNTNTQDEWKRDNPKMVSLKDEVTNQSGKDARYQQNKR